MPDDRFRPPESDVGDSPRRRASAVRGLLVGFGVDVAGTTVFNIAVGAIYAMTLAAGGHSEAEIGTAMANAASDPWVAGVSLVGGCAFSIVGGYLCERIARRGNYRLAGVLAAVGVGFGMLLGSSIFASAEDALLAVLTVGSVLLGTHLAFERQPGATAPP